jgi:hypothetical protein
LVLDLDATLVICHSEKESATPTYKKTFGYHPLPCFPDGTREALPGLLREGRAGSNTTADHIAVLDQAITQIPDVHRHGNPILIRSDSAGVHPRVPGPYPNSAPGRHRHHILRRRRDHRTDPRRDPPRHPLDPRHQHPR